jgi:hypothetical protein
MRLANSTPPPPLWPPILAGSICGVFYLGGAALAYRRIGRAEDYEAERSRPQRFITPDESSETPNEYGKTADRVATETEPPVWVETIPRRRAPFAFDDDPGENTAPRKTAFFSDEEGSVSVATREEPASEKPVVEKAAEKDDGQEGAPEKHEEEVEAADPFAEQLKKSLSETEIGRMFERGQDPSSASFTDSPDETRHP